MVEGVSGRIIGGRIRGNVSDERRLVQILEGPAGQQFAPSQRPEVVSSFVFSDATRMNILISRDVELDVLFAS